MLHIDCNSVDCTYTGGAIYAICPQHKAPNPNLNLFILIQGCNFSFVCYLDHGLACVNTPSLKKSTLHHAKQWNLDCTILYTL